MGHQDLIDQLFQVREKKHKLFDETEKFYHNWRVVNYTMGQQFSGL